MTARKTAARRVTAALAAAAVAFSGAVLLAPSASADGTVDSIAVVPTTASVGATTSLTFTVEVTGLQASTADTVTIPIPVAANGTGAVVSGTPTLGSSTRSGASVDANSTPASVVVNFDNTQTATSSTVVISGLSLVTTAAGTATVAGQSITVTADPVSSTDLTLSVDEVVTVSDNATSDAANFNLRATSTLFEGQTIILTLNSPINPAATTWSGKPTVRVGSSTLSARNVVVDNNVLRVTLDDDVTAGTTIYFSNAKVRVPRGAVPGAVTLSGAGSPVDYVTISGADLSLAAQSIARSTVNSITYAPVGSITLTLREQVTNPVIRFDHEGTAADAIAINNGGTITRAGVSTNGTAPGGRANSVDVTFTGTFAAGTYRISGIRLAGYTAGTVVVTARDGSTEIAKASNKITITSGSEDRIAGADRYNTSAILAVNYWDELRASGTTGSTVIVANGENVRGGADALAASFLAGAAQAPVVLVSQDSISASVLVALRAQAQVTANAGNLRTVYVLGDENAVAASVATQLESLVDNAADVVRIAGADRFATSAAVVQEALDLDPTLGRLALTSNDDLLTTAFIANGWNTVDALFAASLAYQGYPVLLTNGTGLADVVADAIEDGEIEQVIALGSETSVAASVLTAAAAIEVNDDDVVTGRIGGATRFDTAAAFNEVALDDDLVDNELNGAKAFLFDGFGFADALSAAAYAGIEGSVLVPTWNSELAGASRTFLTENATAVNTVVALGGTDRVESSVLEAAVVAAR